MMKLMVLINKYEKEIIAERFPDVHIVRTMKQDSKRHHYYCEEAKRAMRILNKLRNPKLTHKEGTDNSYNKKR